MEQFTWVETYKEIANKLREYTGKQQELIKILGDIQSQGLPTISLMDTNVEGVQIPLTEIDPFTFFANFNRGIKTEARIEIIQILKKLWGLSSDIPSDFSGIPLVNNMQSWFIAYQKDRGEKDVALLWDLFIQALDNDIHEETFNEVLQLKYIRNKITIGLFWISPERYLNLDKVNRAYLAANGISVKRLTDFKEYSEIMKRTSYQMKKPFYQISHDAWLEENEDVGEDGKLIRTWLFAPGRGGEYWEEFYTQGIMAIGWDYLGDLKQYSTKNDIVRAMRDHENDPEASKRNNVTSCFSFCNVMKPGDTVLAKIGSTKIVGWGIVTSDYSFDPTRQHYKHVRSIEWKKKGVWTTSSDNRLPLKTLTDITRYTEFVNYLNKLIETLPQEPDEPGSTKQYWWLNANPKIWDIIAAPVGSTQTYTSHNAQGNKRRVYQYFKQVNPGDLIIGYVASPVRQVVALCEVTKGLHDTEEGEVFEFKKIEQFPDTIPFKDLQSVPELKNCEPLINNQGSLFRLMPNEYEIIRSIIDEVIEPVAGTGNLEQVYSLEECMQATGFPQDMLISWKAALERKKQAVFFGPPGTGKTFVANHLARHMVGGTDGFIDFIQFHPAYTYEEFMQGIRPDTDEKGNLLFNLKHGRFMEFCIRARQRTGPCVLIIDEINRANLARVFGELMYLLEYRDKDISLAGGVRFSIPSNVYVIGTMNTADRSIALVDFALRRRFAFLELFPEYEVLKVYQAKKGFNAQGLVQVLQEVNTKINDKNFSLGISFFMVDDLVKKLAAIWKMEIETYLEEYFFSQPEVLINYRWDKIKGKVLS